MYGVCMGISNLLQCANGTHEKPKNSLQLFSCFIFLVHQGMHSLICIMQDVYFDDESAEVVISSLRLGDEQGR